MDSGKNVAFVQSRQDLVIPFVKTDFSLLSRHFNVKSVVLVLDRRMPFQTLRSIILLVACAVWSDVVFSWFAGLQSYLVVRLCRILGSKSVVVLGGYEVKCIPEIQYGGLFDPKNAKRIRYTISNADVVLAVDEGLRLAAIANAHVNGYNIATVPTGYDSSKFSPSGAKEDLALSVAFFSNWQRVCLKGLDTFVEAARYLPDVKFLVVGGSGDAVRRLRNAAPKNVEILGPLSQEEIIEYYRRARVYCQLSLSEGMPNSLCEAMLCECVPVGTRIPGILSAIGDTGYYVPIGDPEKTAEGIRDALASNSGVRARERIAIEFTDAQRESKLMEILNADDFAEASMRFRSP